MKRKTAVRHLNELDGHDQEVDHCMADEILVEVLRSYGLGDVADAFMRARSRVGFWYA